MKEFIRAYRQSINPPYEHRDLFTFIATISLFLFLPLIVFAIIQSRGQGSEATKTPVTPKNQAAEERPAPVIGQSAKKDPETIAPAQTPEQASPSAQNDDKEKKKDVQGAATYTVHQEVINFQNLLNNYRQQNGLAPVKASYDITEAAEWMAKDMGDNNRFGHTDSLGQSPWTRMCNFGYCYNTWKGENIAAGYSTAQGVFDGWKASPGHNANMLGSNYKVVGIYLYVKPGSTYTYYWVNDFGGEEIADDLTTYVVNDPAFSETDSDGDKFSNARETYLGTNYQSACGNQVDTTRQSRPSMLFPPDLKSGTLFDTNWINISDIVSFSQKIDLSEGDAGYDNRWDLNGDRVVNMDDVNLYTQNGWFNKSCGVITGQDTALPTCTISKPTNGQTVSGSPTMTVSFSDNKGIAGFRIFSEGRTLKEQSGSALSASFTWNSKLLKNGDRKLTCMVIDTFGNRGTKTVSVKVAN